MPSTEYKTYCLVYDGKREVEAATTDEGRARRILQEAREKARLQGKKKNRSIECFMITATTTTTFARLDWL